MELRSSTTLVRVPSGGARRDVDERANWVWLSVIPFGLGAWAPIYAGARVNNRRWMSLGAVWSLIAAMTTLLHGAWRDRWRALGVLRQ